MEVVVATPTSLTAWRSVSTFVEVWSLRRVLLVRPPLAIPERPLFTGQKGVNQY